MPAQVTTRAQVSGYRFLLRRLQHALVRGDSRMIHDPMRGQMRAMLTGMAFAMLIAGAAGVLAFFKPAPNFGNSSIMLSESDGTLYVRIADRLHPTLNLASARLIAGKSEAPGRVDNKFLDSVARGPVVGIVGAPNSLHAASDLTASAWAVCDSQTSPGNTTAAPSTNTTVLAGDPVLGDATRPAASGDALLAASGGRIYLIFDGVRAAIDTTDPVLVKALGLAGIQIRDISPGLLNSFPLVPPIQPIQLPGVGSPTSYLPADLGVGSIVRTVDSRGEQLFVVLPGGLQPVSPVTADIIRYSDARSAGNLDATSISPARLRGIPIITPLPVDHYPMRQLKFSGAASAPVLCMAWRRPNYDGEATTRLLTGSRLPLPAGAQPVRLATADGAGPGLDAVYVKPGTGEYVEATGTDPDSHAPGQLFYVNDLGLRFHVKDTATAHALGLVGVKDGGGSTERAQPAPWPVLSLLPPGPELSQEAALIVHDGMAADPAGAAITPQH